MKAACSHPLHRARLLLLSIALCIGIAGHVGSAFATPKMPAAHFVTARSVERAVGQLSPAFTLADAGGHKRSLRDFRGHPVALFFFCGCPQCRSLAQTWSRFQQGGALQSPATLNTASMPVSMTVIVFSGDADSARVFATDTGLDLTQTVLLPDPTMLVTQTLYHADPCPRAFVLDGLGIVRYTNSHDEGAPRQASDVVIASRVLDVLRNCALPPAKERRRHPAAATAPVPRIKD